MVTLEPSISRPTKCSLWRWKAHRCRQIYGTWPVTPRMPSARQRSDRRPPHRWSVAVASTSKKSVVGRRSKHSRISSGPHKPHVRYLRPPSLALHCMQPPARRRLRLHSRTLVRDLRPGTSPTTRILELWPTTHSPVSRGRWPLIADHYVSNGRRHRSRHP